MRMLILVACLWLATNTLDAKIVFRSSRAGEGGEIYTMNSDGSNQMRITDHPRGSRMVSQWEADFVYGLRSE